LKHEPGPLKDAKEVIVPKVSINEERCFKSDKRPPFFVGYLEIIECRPSLQFGVAP
jgi:hypothetical protein